MRNKKGMVLIAGGLLLLAAAFALTGYNIWDERRATSSVANTMEELASAIPAPETVTLPEGTVPDYVAAPKMEMPTLMLDGYDYIGYLDIPSIGVLLPVMADWSYPNLKLSPCRYTGSAYQGDLVICAHNYQGHFGALKNLVIGDEVAFTDIDGNGFRYRVVELEQLSSSDIEGMCTGDWDLSLFTCTIGGQYRVAVRCEQIKTPGEL